MALSRQKQEKMARVKRQKEVQERSLTGQGSFWEPRHDASAAKYIETGEQQYLSDLPDYRKIRQGQGIRN